MPDLTLEALQWLLSTRGPGVWATLPRLPGSSYVEPLLAHYDFRSRMLLEEVVRRGQMRPALIAASPKVFSPVPPEGVVGSWRNVNTMRD